jgi:hypothetical protein
MAMPQTRNPVTADKQDSDSETFLTEDIEKVVETFPRPEVGGPGDPIVPGATSSVQFPDLRNLPAEAGGLSNNQIFILTLKLFT